MISTDWQVRNRPALHISSNPVEGRVATLKFYREHKLICWWPDGDIGSQEVLTYFQALAECDWGWEANRFCDFSRVKNFNFDYIGLRSLAERRKRELDEHQNIKLVNYSSSPLGFGMARMYQTLMEDWPIEVFVKKDLEKCAEILGVEISLLKRPEEEGES